MNTADLITSYLNNEMSPEQERQFLLSVAASDSLRLALKSHVMLDKVLFRQARELSVPEGVRATIFAEAGASLAATTPPQAPRGRGGLPPIAAGFALLLALAGGFGSGYVVGHAPAEESAAALTLPSVTVPVVTFTTTGATNVLPEAPQADETSTQEPVSVAERPQPPASSRVTDRSAVATRRPDRPAVDPAANPSEPQVSPSVPHASEPATSRPATVTVEEPTVSSSNEQKP